jgi:excinuclease ABC subunit A
LSRVANRRPAIAVSNVIEGVADATFSFSPSSPFSLHFIPLFSIESSLSRLVAHEIGAIEPLAKLFASSQQAKMLGLSPRELAIGQARHSASICGTCRGSGLVLAEAGELLSGASLCPSCWGSRFSAPARDVTFKGRTLWQLLNSTIHEATPVLQALPKMSHVLELLQLFDLTHIPLGVPTSLLPRTTRRLLSAARAAISATTNRPSLVVIEEPFVGLSAKQRSRLSQVASHSYTTGKVAWVGV